MRYFLSIFLCFSLEAQEKLKEINLQYLEKIKPIFKRACFDCHTNQVLYPWYYSIPGIKQLIDFDIKEGLEHLDMSRDYPFKGSKKGLKHDMEEILKTIEEGEMPPFFYRIISKDRKLSDEDKSIIKIWVEQSLKEL